MYSGWTYAYWCCAIIGIASVPYWIRYGMNWVVFVIQCTYKRYHAQQEHDRIYRHTHERPKMPRRDIPESWKMRMLFQQQHRCATCWRRLDQPPWPIDHIVPLHLGGLHAEWNLQTLCSNCHGFKTSLEATARAKDGTKV